jgi:hypothetical protein
LKFAQFLTLVVFVSVFSRKRKSERIERKIKTQNPNLGGDCSHGGAEAEAVAPLKNKEKGKGKIEFRKQKARKQA